MNALTLKNLLREIKRTFTKFLSIFAICALGVAFFAGIRATSPDMKEAGDRLYNTYNLSDISVISTSGLTADNIRDLESIEGIQAVRASLFVDAMARGTDEKEKNLRLYSMPIKLKSEYAPLIDLIPDYGIDTSPEYEMNGVEIVSGRMPLNDTETALDYTLEGSLVKQLGDEITLTTSGGTVTLRVVGFIRSPMYISMFERGTSSIGNGTSDGFAYASGNAISSLGTKLPVMSLLNTYYTRADIVISGKEGLSAYSDEYEALVNEVTDRIEDYASTQSGTWYIQDRSGNPGYSDYSENTDRIAAVGDVFPLIFFIVAALVCLTTMTRMVEEQRIEMGTMKALGYGGWQIAMKYAVYAMSACISGGVVGAIIGFKLFPYVIMKGYSIMYYLGKLETPYRADIAFMAIAAMAVCTAAATFSACYASLKEVPATLMRPKAPKAGRRVLLEKMPFIWKKLSFTSKVTVRNLFRYKKRFFMSVIGIAGSGALLVTAFGLNDSIFGIIEKQFGDIWQMDVQAYVYEAMPLADMQELLGKNPANDDFDSVMFCLDSQMECKNGGRSQSGVHLLGVESAGSMAGRINLHNGGAPVTLDDSGVVVTAKLAETLSIKIGDGINMRTGGEDHLMRVIGVADNYVYHYVYITAAYYETVFGKAMQYNGFMGNLKDGLTDETMDAMSTQLLSDSRMYTVRTIGSIYDSVWDSLSILNYVVLVLILGSGMLTFVVMLNLTNINIGERMRELATLRVLGFYDKEMYAYIFRENNALSVIGAFVGLVFGKIMHLFVIRTCEVDMVMFVRSAKPLSYVYAFALTIAFSLIVNLLMRPKVRAIDMVESLKSAE
ncbi:efflux ABC transporter permease protein [Clostridium sp. CAG:226]|jgi:putative ABC transport system permease protein|nr:efflux ABC transporter permease protein [Clostridium sp. CAG:226]